MYRIALIISVVLLCTCGKQSSSKDKDAPKSEEGRPIDNNNDPQKTDTSLEGDETESTDTNKPQDEINADLIDPPETVNPSITYFELCEKEAKSNNEQISQALIEASLWLDNKEKSCEEKNEILKLKGSLTLSNAHIPLELQIYRESFIFNPFYLSEVKKLVTLSFVGVKISDTIPLLTHKNLLWLDIIGAGLEDIDFLRPLANSKILNLNLGKNVKIHDISVLSEFDGLVLLTLQKNNIKDLSSLKGLRLKFLYVGSNPIESIEILSSNSELENLDIKNTFVSDLYPLANLEKLKELKVSEGSITPKPETCPIDAKSEILVKFCKTLLNN